jgi:hypothetical protein
MGYLLPFPNQLFNIGDSMCSQNIKIRVNHDDIILLSMGISKPLLAGFNQILALKELKHLPIFAEAVNFHRYFDSGAMRIHEIISFQWLCRGALQCMPSINKGL